MYVAKRPFRFKGEDLKAGEALPVQSRTRSIHWLLTSGWVEEISKDAYRARQKRRAARDKAIAEKAASEAPDEQLVEADEPEVESTGDDSVEEIDEVVIDESTEEPAEDESGEVEEIEEGSGTPDVVEATGEVSPPVTKEWLMSMKRDELDSYALAVGIEDPKVFGKKEDVADAILEKITEKP